MKSQTPHNKTESLLFVDYVLKGIGVIAVAVIAYNTGIISQKVEEVASMVKDHETRLRVLEK